MVYHYKARDASGALRIGQLEMGSREQALAHLQQQGLLVVELRAGRRFAWRARLSLEGLQRVGSRDLAAFCGQLAALLEAGVPVLPSLQVLAREFDRGPLGRLLPRVIRAIEGGTSFSQALREHEALLPPLLVYLTAAAEVSGTLAPTYARMAEHFEQEDHFMSKVKSAFTYPVVVLSVAVAVILFMVTVILPTYGELFAEMGAELPAPTQALLAFGRVLKEFWYLALLGLALLGWGVRRLLAVPRVRERWERLWLRVPVFGRLVYRRYLTEFCRSLGMMLRSGVPLLPALATLQVSLTHQPFREAVGRVMDRVQRGEAFGRALAAQPLFDRTTVEIVSLGESAGALDTMLLRIAAQSERDVNILLDRLTQLVQPALTVVLGVVVASIIVPMILPMFDLIGKVQ